MHTVIRQLFHWMPPLFGIGFIAPLIAQAMTLSGIAAPFGMSPVALGLAVGASWGLYAFLRGRWI